jgi:hypothetical protein
MWPGVPVVPVMSTGTTDSLYLRKAGIFGDSDDGRAHGKDQRIGVKEFYAGRNISIAPVKAFTSANSNQRQTADQ